MGDAKITSFFLAAVTKVPADLGDGDIWVIHGERIGDDDRQRRRGGWRNGRLDLEAPGDAARE